MQVPAQIASTPVIAVQDRRLINAKIHDVYGDNGYVGEWTDKKVALDLGVPIEHVTYLREQNFGPCGSNPGIDELIERANGIAKELLSKAAQVMAVAQDLRDEAANLTAQAEVIKAGITEVKAALKG